MARQGWKNQGFFETFRNEGLAHWNRSVLELTLQKKLDSVSLGKPGFFWKSQKLLGSQYTEKAWLVKPGNTRFSWKVRK